MPLLKVMIKTCLLLPFNGTNFICAKPIEYSINNYGLIEETSPTIVGSWKLTSISHVKITNISSTESMEERIISKCNTCPTVIFDSDGNGYIKSNQSDSISTYFNWRISKKNVLFIKLKNIASKSILKSGLYTISHHIDILHGQAIDLKNKNNVQYSFVKLNTYLK